MYAVAKRRVLILDNLVSVGTLGILSLRLENAELIDIVLLLSFLLPGGFGKVFKLVDVAEGDDDDEEAGN